MHCFHNSEAELDKRDEASWVPTQQDYIPGPCSGLAATRLPWSSADEKLGPVPVAWPGPLCRGGGLSPAWPASQLTAWALNWLLAKLPPLSAGWHPGPDAMGPAGGQQLEHRRAVIPASRLQAGLGVGASSRPTQPSGASTAALALSTTPQVGASAELRRASHGGSSEKSTVGQWVHRTVWSLLQPPFPHLENGAT